MTATYCVSVKGTTNFGNQSTINFAIEKQQIMLQSFKISSEYLFDNKLSVAGELSEDGEALQFQLLQPKEIWKCH